MRTVLVVFTAVSVFLGHAVWDVNRRRETVRNLQQHGAYVDFLPGPPTSFSRRILVMLLDDLACYDVERVAFSGWASDDHSLMPVRYHGETSDLHNLRTLREVKELNLMSVDLADDDLAHLVRLTKLEILRLDDTPLTDQCVAYLAHMKSLKFVTLAGTNVTRTGFETLHQALPKCVIRTQHPEARTLLPDQVPISETEQMLSP